MAKRTMSPAALKRISEAAKRRWAKYRQMKAAGKLPQTKSIWTPAKRAEQARKIRAALARKRGRPAAAAATGNLAGESTDALITLRRRIDQELADRLVRGTA
ncbi:MAG: hypothetical protein L6Q92_03640 [Phycisphaerae bacterium]|nr:hypothetical protein [Phycisphaerae bacterium]